MLTKRIIASLGVAAALVLGVIAFRFVADAENVDSCLDQGGSFDYQTMRCDFDASHAFASYSTRHPADKAVAVGAFAVVIGAATMYKRKAC